ncbi:MAG TPA: SLC13 family permease, partial [Deinococcales bacterium]|nr:SLC13 family permease [Deinococcales bacterium]
LPLGLACLAAGWLYLLTVGRWLLPEEGTTEFSARQESGHYVMELHVTEDSDVHDDPVEIAELSAEHRVYVLELWRNDERLWSPRSETLQDGDVLLVRGRHENLLELQDDLGLQFGAVDPEADDSEEEPDPAEQVMAEVMIAPNSVAIGHRLATLGRGLTSQVTVLGIQRRGEIIREQLQDTVLRLGDILLLIMPEAAVTPMRRSRNFIILSELSVPLPRSWRAPFALLVMALVVALPALGFLPIAVSATLGALAVVLAGCLPLDDAYEAVDWRIIFLMAGLLPLGLAMNDSGAAQYIVDNTVGLLLDAGPHVVLAVLYLMALLLGELMSNSAAAVLLTPIGLSTAQLLGADPTPFLIAITFSASTSFLTPVGYQTNTMVYSAGGYRFMDFVRVGLPLNLIFWGLGVLLIPVFWPF